MDNTKIIKIDIVRTSDNTTFSMGENTHWRFLSGGLDGFGEVSNTINYCDNATSDGGFVSSTHVTKVDRTINSAFVDLSDNMSERKKVLAFFNVKSTFKVYVSYGDRKVWAEGYLAKLQLSTGSRITNRLDLMVTFTFPNPYWKSFDDFGEDIASLRGMIAFPFLCSIDNGPIGTTGGIFTFAPKVVLYNEGDVETYCRAIIKASGPVENPILYINDEYVRVIDTMQKHDEIVIDFTMSPPTVKKNGENFIGHCDRTSAFDSMILDKGRNVVSFSADDGSTKMSVIIYYNELYEAI